MQVTKHITPEQIDKLANDLTFAIAKKLDFNSYISELDRGEDMDKIKAAIVMVLNNTSL